MDYGGQQWEGNHFGGGDQNFGGYQDNQGYPQQGQWGPGQGGHGFGEQGLFEDQGYEEDYEEYNNFNQGRRNSNQRNNSNQDPGMSFTAWAAPGEGVDFEMEQDGMGRGRGKKKKKGKNKKKVPSIFDLQPPPGMMMGRGGPMGEGPMGRGGPPMGDGPMGRGGPPMGDGPMGPGPMGADPNLSPAEQLAMRLQRNRGGPHPGRGGRGGPPQLSPGAPGSRPGPKHGFLAGDSSTEPEERNEPIGLNVRIYVLNNETAQCKSIEVRVQFMLRKKLVLTG